MRGWFVAALLLVSGGCALHEGGNRPELGADVLVTFKAGQFRDPLPGGSQHAYRAAHTWSVTLHARKVMNAFARDHGLVEIEAWPIEALGVYCVAYATDSNETAAQLTSRLQADPRIELVQPNHRFAGMTRTAPAYDDPLFALQYGRYQHALQEVHAVSRGERARVAIIDSGVDVGHPDLSGQIRRQIEFLESDSTAARLHGTAVAGIIGAASGNGEGLVGLAPAADIQVFAACAERGNETLCTSLSLAKALSEALEDDVEIFNISLAGPDDPLLESLIKRAMDRGHVVIAADNSPSSLNFPASLDGVVAAREDNPFWFAQGEQLSTQAGGGYRVFSGSSMAAAGLSGMAAVIRAVNNPASTRAALDWLEAADCTVEPPVLEGIEVSKLCPAR